LAQRQTGAKAQSLAKPCTPGKNWAFAFALAIACTWLGACTAGTVTPAQGQTQAANTPAAPTQPPQPVTTDSNVPVTGAAGPVHTLTFVNSCAQTVWVGALANDANMPLPNGGGWALAPGAQSNITLVGNWGGRFWGRVGCAAQGNTFTCASGDCGALTCAGRGGQPASLAEFLLYDANGKDFYDISLVDAFNLPLSIAPTPGTFAPGPAADRVCTTSVCATDILAQCPTQLQSKDPAGKVVACLSACSRYNTDATCCRNAYDTAEACPPSDLSRLIKAACPNAYSYAYDDKSSTYTCVATGYTITLCPQASGGT
jgi:hypothetical protein